MPDVLLSELQHRIQHSCVFSNVKIPKFACSALLAEYLRTYWSTAELIYFFFVLFLSCMTTPTTCLLQQPPRDTPPRNFRREFSKIENFSPKYNVFLTSGLGYTMRRLGLCLQLVLLINVSDALSSFDSSNCTKSAPCW